MFKMVYLWRTAHKSSPIKSMGIFTDAKEQLTPQSEVGSSWNSNSYKLSWLSSLPAKMKKVQSKMKELEWSQHYTTSFQTLKGS